MARNYAFKDYNPEKMARVFGSDLPISTKHTIEICNTLKNKRLHQAKTILEDAINMKRPIPFTRFTSGAGHKKGNLASGKYPIKASKEILTLLDSLESNAQQKGLNSSDLFLVHLCANKASRPLHYGRHSGREMKRTHLEIVAEEKIVKKKTPKAAKPMKKEEKTEVKPIEEKKPEIKKEEPKPVEKKTEEKKEEPKPVEKKTEEKKEEPKPEAKEGKPAEKPKIDDKLTTKPEQKTQEAKE